MSPKISEMGCMSIIGLHANLVSYPGQFTTHMVLGSRRKPENMEETYMRLEYVERHTQIVN